MECSHEYSGGLAAPPRALPSSAKSERASGMHCIKMMYRFPSVSGGECKLSLSIHINPNLVTIHQLTSIRTFFVFCSDTSCIIHRIFDVYLHSPPDAMLDAGAGDTLLYISYTAIQSIQRYMAIQCIGCITPPQYGPPRQHARWCVCSSKSYKNPKKTTSRK